MSDVQNFVEFCLGCNEMLIVNICIFLLYRTSYYAQNKCIYASVWVLMLYFILNVYMHQFGVNVIFNSKWWYKRIAAILSWLPSWRPQTFSYKVMKCLAIGLNLWPVCFTDSFINICRSADTGAVWITNFGRITKAQVKGKCRRIRKNTIGFRHPRRKSLLDECQNILITGIFPGLINVLRIVDIRAKRSHVKGVMTQENGRLANDLTFW